MEHFEEPTIDCTDTFVILVFKTVMKDPVLHLQSKFQKNPRTD